MAQASSPPPVVYDFGGHVTLGSGSFAYTGEWVLTPSAATWNTVFLSDQTPQQGFRSTYSGATQSLQLRIDSGETVQAQGGDVWINNIAQAEAGAQVPQGLSMQAWTTGTTGTIGGVTLHGMYLAFLPVDYVDPWDTLNRLGYVEDDLNANPSLLPGNIDPRLTRTAFFADNVHNQFDNGLFLGINFGVTNLLVDVDWFVPRAPVPEPATAWLWAAGALVLATTRRRTAPAQVASAR